MPEEFQLFDSYEDYIMNYLMQIENESDDALDMLTNQKYKISFLSIQSIFGTNRTTSKIDRTHCDSRR